MNQNPLTEAQAALQRGDKILARKLASQALLTDHQNEQAWLLMARLADSPKQVIECLEWALKANPDNASTQNTLRVLKNRSIIKAQPSTAIAPQPAVTTIAPQPATTKAGTQVIKIADVDGKEYHPPHRKINWSLYIGALIVGIVILIAILGPRLAPQDPMEEHAILQVGDKWYIPPYDAFEVKGYLLGSDTFGRDLLSRILYAVRPTLIMVMVVSAVRLVLGTLIGLGAGWSTGRVGRSLDALITAALSVPILLVALGAIAMLGAELGLLAFIVGLSINGWGETARFVREQTRIIKGQLYIESAHALGASTFQMLFRHILRQVMPMVWMLFAFEISGTLMVTAGLGFLGYYIGGDLWIEVSDYVSRRTSGAPELGQMLATSWVNLLQPWPLVLTGSVIFITVLGFNLLGEGLRIRLNPEYINRNSLASQLGHRLSSWFETWVSYPATSWLRGNRLRPVLLAFTLVGVTGVLFLYQTRIAPILHPVENALSVPGDQVWASERIDPYGTAFTSQPTLLNPEKLWTVSHPEGISGSPAVSTDGIVYFASLDGNLTAMNPDGSVHWQVGLPEIPSGPLGIGPTGDIYVGNNKGGLSAVGPDGTLKWTFSTDAFGKPLHGPIIAPGGNIYYLLDDPRGDTLFALQPGGQLLWSVKPGTYASDFTPRLTPDGKELFVKNVIISTQDGSRVDITLPTDNSLVLKNVAKLFVGADAKTYLIAGHVVMQWNQTSQGFNLVRSAEWDYRTLGFYQTASFPVDAVVTPSGTILLIYSGSYGATTVVWMDPTGKFIGWSRSNIYQGMHVVEVDKNENITLCGIAPTDQGAYSSICETYQAGKDEPPMVYLLGVDDGGVVGVSTAPDRLYVVTGDGILTALGYPKSVIEPSQTP